MSKECYDHLGNVFKSVNDMCKNYGINTRTFRSRIIAGLSVRDALTLKVKSKDHHPITRYQE